MATMGTKPTLLLGLMVAALVVVAAAQQPEDKKNLGVVTIYNPAGLVLDILNGDKNVKVTTQMATLELTELQQTFHITIGIGAGGITIDVAIDDKVVLIPDPASSGNVLAFKVLVGEEPSVSKP